MNNRELLVEQIKNGTCAWNGVELEDIPFFSEAKVTRLLQPRPQAVPVTREVISAYNRHQWTMNDSYNESHGQPTVSQREFLDRVKRHSGKRSISMLDVNIYNKAQ